MKKERKKQRKKETKKARKEERKKEGKQKRKPFYLVTNFWRGNKLPVTPAHVDHGTSTSTHCLTIRKCKHKAQTPFIDFLKPEVRRPFYPSFLDHGSRSHMTNHN